MGEWKAKIDSETTLYYMRARYFDPKMGRFVSEDPLGTDGGNVDFCRFKYYDPATRGILREARILLQGGPNFYRY